MRRTPSAPEVGILLFFNGAAGLALLVSSVLREDPLFWRNAGGYPVFVRHMVYYLHYPLLLLVFAGTLAASLLALQFFALTRGATGARLLLACGFQWLLFAAALTIMLWNNIVNLLNGHPLHYHVNL
jgi:hypothetical protein